MIYALLLLNILIFSFTDTAMACSMCFYGSPKQNEVIALKASVVFLLAVVVSVLALFGKFFFDVSRREKIT